MCTVALFVMSKKEKQEQLSQPTTEYNSPDVLQWVNVHAFSGVSTLGTTAQL